MDGKLIFFAPKDMGNDISKIETNWVFIRIQN